MENTCRGLNGWSHKHCQELKGWRHKGCQQFQRKRVVLQMACRNKHGETPEATYLYIRGVKLIIQDGKGGNQIRKYFQKVWEHNLILQKHGTRDMTRAYKI